MNILVLQPIRPSNLPALREQADALLSRMVAANPDLTFDVRQDDRALEIPPHPSIYMRHATIRNYMLDTYLRPEHTHVLWIDSDLIDYPAELPRVLLDASMTIPRRCPHCGGSRSAELFWMNYTCFDCHAMWPIRPDVIVAPFALLDKWPNRFYDIGGFIEKGNRARMWAPWFEQDGAVIELDSVGCCYLVPAALYRDGVRYQPPPTDYYVEHWSVMQQAKRRGYRIFALRDVRVLHAWLPDYGMELN